MKIIRLLGLSVTMSFCALRLFAQEFRSAENDLYWKNRKPFEGYWQQDVAYKINATLIDKDLIIDGEEFLTYYNNSPDTLKEVYFHLYQNAFIKGSYLEKLNLANGFKQRFGPYEKSGKGTEIENIKVNNQQPQIWLDNTILKVSLNEPLLPNASIEVYIKFKTYFDDGGNQRRRMKTFTDEWGNRQFNAVHWYPRISVYDRKFKWTTDQHLSKEFYGDFGSYDVKLNIPNHYIVDATGNNMNEKDVMPQELKQKLNLKNFANKPWGEKPSVIIEPNGTLKTWHFVAINVHDFAWVADPTFRIGEEELILKNGHKVKLVALAQEPHARGWQDAAAFTKKVIDVYSNDFGAYAYPKMICVDARDGMEYPMLTLDGGSSPGYYGLIAHEVGHNWFFGMVGNNETYRASLDEGFTQFLTHWSTLKILGENKKPRYKNAYRNKYSRTMPSMDAVVYNGYFRDAIQNYDKALNTHSDDFDNALGHGGGYGNVYYKTATMLYNLQYVLGDDLFKSAMQHYFNQWKFCHPYFEDFRASIIDYTKTDLNWFFDQWLETTKHTDYAIKSIKNIKNDSVEITLMRKGQMQMPLDISVIFKDQSVQNILIPNTYFTKQTTATVLPYWKGWGKLNTTYTFKLHAPNKLNNVIIDPSYRLADVNQLNNSYKLPLVFSFDHQLKTPADRRNYYLKWRPDLWYNNFDGVKAGIHLNGNYYQLKHVFSATVWFNTQLLKDYKGVDVSNNLAPINYAFSYKHLIATRTTFNLQSRFLDGLALNALSVEKVNHEWHYKIFAKSLYRPNQADLIYLSNPYDDRASVNSIKPLLPWVAGRLNNYIGVETTKYFNKPKHTGYFRASAQGSALFSDYNYSSIKLTFIDQTSLHKLEIRLRGYAENLLGNIASESFLYAAGANPEQLMDNKFTRTVGIVPGAYLGYGTATNNFQMGGGLNLRGYNGYLLPVIANNTNFFLFNGNIGGAVNIEVDFDQYLNIKPSVIKDFIHIDSYLFADAGIIGSTNNILKPNPFNRYTDLLADAGAGLALTIKKWGMLDDPKPLTIRFDMPLYLSNVPFAESDNLQFRWLLGIGRTF